MKLLFLSKENIPLARGEAESLLGKGILDENVLEIKTKKSTTRLAQTKYIGEVLLKAKNKDIDKKLEKFDWNKIIKGSFGVFAIQDNNQSHTLSRKYGGIIYDCLKNPKVELENPDTPILIIETAKNTYVCIKEWENNNRFIFRKPKTWPAQRPITLDPKLARTCVNLTGAKKEIYDPMCGIGGFLIEAGLMGLTAIGSDIDKELVTLASINLKHHEVKKFLVFPQDVLAIQKKYDCIVTDVPYGKNTKNVTVDFYMKFLSKIRKIVKKRAVLMFPDFAHAESVIKKSTLKIKAKYSVFIHGSLTREIFVVEP